MLLIAVVAVGVVVGYVLLPKPGGVEFIKEQLTWPRPTPTPTPPPGCYYEEVICIQAPCPPVLVCPTPGARHEPNGSVETANWKTYTSGNHRFSIKYPPTWLYREVVDPALGVDEVWFSTQALGFPPGQTGARAPVVLKITTVDPSSDWSPEYFDQYESIPYKFPSDLTAKKVSGTNKESRTRETAVIVSIDGRYILALPNETSDSLTNFDQILSTFKFTQ